MPLASRHARNTSGAIAQLVERLNGIQEVSGSTPLSSTSVENDRLDKPGSGFQNRAFFVRPADLHDTSADLRNQSVQSSWEYLSLPPADLMRALLPVLALVLSGCGLGHLPYHSPTVALPNAAFLTATQHDSVMAGRDWPYNITLNSAQGDLFYFGSYHTNDPDDPQVDVITTSFEQFGPTLALTENTGGFAPGGPRRAIKNLGEFGLVIRLADRDGIPIYSLEPTWDDEIGMVTERFTPAEATVFYTLRVYLSERGDERDPAKMDKLARHLLGKRGSRPGLDGVIPDLAAFDAVWRQSFGDERDWRTLPPEAIWPGHEPTKLQAISRFVNEVRDRHMARVILDFVMKGERVFAIAGGSHVVKQEPVLRAALDQ